MNIFKRVFLTVAGLFVLTHTVQAHYDPNIGRWISRDPIAEVGGVNLYEYAGNDGINAIDYLGLWKSWTHRHLTDHAWKQVDKPSDMTSRIQKDLLKILKKRHAWQDYYAHAVYKGYAGGTDFQNIGYISGDPEHPGADVKPSSRGGIWDPQEHRWIEPGKRAPDHAQREQAATAFTQKGYQAFLDKWWPVCKCFYLK